MVGWIMFWSILGIVMGVATAVLIRGMMECICAGEWLALAFLMLVTGLAISGILITLGI